MNYFRITTLNAMTVDISTEIDMATLVASIKANGQIMFPHLYVPYAAIAMITRSETPPLVDLQHMEAGGKA